MIWVFIRTAFVYIIYQLVIQFPEIFHTFATFFVLKKLNSSLKIAMSSKYVKIVFLREAFDMSFWNSETVICFYNSFVLSSLDVIKCWPIKN